MNTIKPIAVQRVTTKPVTTGGWYEHTDGTVGRYLWVNGQVMLSQVVASWALVPESNRFIDEPNRKHWHV